MPGSPSGTFPAPSTPNGWNGRWLIFADRADIVEEIDRLTAHITAFGAALQEKKAVGRRLEFLTQELHREMNTIASKADSLDVTRFAVDGKTAIERLRKQYKMSNSVIGLLDRESSHPGVVNVGHGNFVLKSRIIVILAGLSSRETLRERASEDNLFMDATAGKKKCGRSSFWTRGTWCYRHWRRKRSRNGSMKMPHVRSCRMSGKKENLFS